VLFFGGETKKLLITFDTKKDAENELYSIQQTLVDYYKK
jgi:hypothetical protein